MKSKPQITIDTNCIIGLLDHDAETVSNVPELQELISLAFSGAITICITTRVEVDLSRDKNDQRRSRMLSKLAMFPVIGGVLRWDQSKWDGADTWCGPATEELLTEVQRICFPGLQPDNKRYLNKLADIDHLTSHRLSQRDIFVTNDKGILSKAGQLSNSLGIKVMSPKDCLDFVRQNLPKLPPISPSLDDYQSSALQGRVSFDYSNNNGRFTIGHGMAAFETQWSKASDTSIRAYSDPASLDAIALAKRADDFGNLTSAENLDYSSRCRTAHPGQIVIWRNINGYYAATKVLSIQDDDRGAERDELEFDYVILDDGSTNFSAK